MLPLLHIAPPIGPLSAHPPSGAEKSLLLLAEAQARRGHSVEIVCVRGSSLPNGVRLASVDIEPGIVIPIDTGVAGVIPEDPDHLEREWRAFGSLVHFLAGHRDRYEVIHNHSYDSVPLFELNSLGIPIIHTLHSPPIVAAVNTRLRAGDLPRHARYITISKRMAELYHRELSLEFPIVPYGIDVSSIPFRDRAEDHFLWAGRISPEKGLHTAIECVARRAGRKLRVAGPVYDEEYYRRDILPLFNNPLVTYLGFLAIDEIYREMGRAQALIFPIAWEEPFGMVLIEALATGTPVIAFRRGTVDEILTHGRDSLIVANEAELVRSLRLITTIDRRACRRTVEERFSLERTLDAIEREYSAAIAAVRTS